jgi:hypothetical protein
MEMNMNNKPLNATELRILALLSRRDIRGTASLGQEAIPSDRPSRSAQGAALAVGRFARSLVDKGFITWFTAENDKLATYKITPAGLDAYEQSRASVTPA